jgi:AICAR transformylase/IMP cyclohydrolase PurH
MNVGTNETWSKFFANTAFRKKLAAKTFARTAVYDAAISGWLAEVLEVFRKEEATHIDAAAERLQRPIASVSEAVLQLELGGWLRALPGARYLRVK